MGPPPPPCNPGHACHAPFDCLLQHHGRLLPPTGRMYYAGGGEGSDEEAAAERRSAGGAAAAEYEGALPAPPAFEGALPPPPLPPPPAPPPLSAVPFDYRPEQPGAGQGPYAAMGFSYGEEEGEQGVEAPQQPQPEQRQQQQQQQATQEELPFSAPFLIPERLRAHLPATQRQYKVRASDQQPETAPHGRPCACAGRRVPLAAVPPLVVHCMGRLDERRCIGRLELSHASRPATAAANAGPDTG